MKNIKRTVITAMAVISILAFSACGNVDEVRSERDPAESAATTSAQEDSGTVTTVPMTTTTPRKSSMTTASETEAATTTTVTTANVASEKKTTTTTKVTTTTTAKTTVTTTVKKTETKKTTTTAKKVTTTKKKTTTPKVTTTKKVTTTAKPAAKLTQKDIDKLVKELQAYSDEIAYDSIYESVRTSRKYKDATEEQVLARVQEHYEAGWKKTPETSSWNTPFDYFSDWTYEEVRKSLYNGIDGEYILSPNSHIVLYPEYHNDEYGEYWLIYPLR